MAKKSLIEAAAEVMSGQQLEEGIPTVGKITGGVSNPDPVDHGATMTTGNAKTLRPKSAPAEADPKHNEAEDLGGATPTSLYKDNLGAKAAGKNKKDKSIKTSVGPDPMKHLKQMGEEEQVEGEVVHEEEETLAERIQALKEARKHKKDKDKDEEECHEEFEMTEELEEFIEECLEQGLTEDEIEEAISENFEFVTEEDESLDEETQAWIEECIESGMSEEEIMDALEEAHTKDQAEKSKEHYGRAVELAKSAKKIWPGSKTLAHKEKRWSQAHAAASKLAKEENEESYKVDMSEHVNALLEGENLSEEFKEKATTIFEAAVNAKIEEEIALLEQAYAETLEEKVSEVIEQLTNDVDDYLNYVVEQWLEDNEVAVESSLRSELTEDFIAGLKALFTEHYIDVPEEQVPVIEELSQTVEELKEQLNEEIEKNVALSSALNESHRDDIIDEVCEGLTEIQSEKLKSLAENVSYTDDEEFATKILTIRENYFPAAVKSNDKVLDNNEMVGHEPGTITEEVDGPMGAYLRALGAKLPN